MQKVCSLLVGPSLRGKRGVEEGGKFRGWKETERCFCKGRWGSGELTRAKKPQKQMNKQNHNPQSRGKLLCQTPSVSQVCDASAWTRIRLSPFSKKCENAEGSAADVWSFGVVYCRLLTSRVLEMSLVCLALFLLQWRLFDSRCHVCITEQ